MTADQIETLWSQFEAEDALFVYSTNAVEGSSLSLNETIFVLQQGIIPGKLAKDHKNAINGQKAYTLMLELARTQGRIDIEMIRALHAAVVGDDNPHCWPNSQ